MNRRGKRVMIARVRGRPALVVCAALAAAALACGPAGSSCPTGDYEQRTCPSPEPSFSTDVAPIFRAKCATCHAPGGLRASTPLTTWKQIDDLLSTVTVYVVTCKMPDVSVGGVALTPEERSTMLDWFACMAPNN
jgi:hypothetical protein